MTPALVLLGAVLLWGGFSFNRLVRLRNLVHASWADIDVQLTRRHDLIPNLVAIVQGYAEHERGTLESVTELRTRAQSLDNPTQLGEVESSLAQGIGRLIALRESYPELAANENFAQLHRDLVEVEDHLQFARRFYNGAVRDYNTTIERVPDVLIAQAFGFTRSEFFQAEAGERSAPEVGGG